MYCNNCGAVAVGKFCSCCGAKLRTEIEMFRLTAKRTHKEYMKQFERFHLPCPNPVNVAIDQIATACWYACEIKYGNGMEIGNANIGYSVAPDAYMKLETVKDRATKLCERLLAAEDF